MGNKFNIGDNVRIIKTSLEGKEGVIKEFTGEDFDPSYTIYFPESGKSTIRYGSELELVNPNNSIINESVENSRIEIEESSVDMKLYIEKNDGEIPHIHFEKVNEDGSVIEGCLCLTYPLYYKHENHQDFLSREDFSSLLDFFNEEYVWEHIIDVWNHNNTIQISESCTVPEYYYGMMTTHDGDSNLERIKDLYE